MASLTPGHFPIPDLHAIRYFNSSQLSTSGSPAKRMQETFLGYLKLDLFIVPVGLKVVLWFWTLTAPRDMIQQAHHLCSMLVLHSA